MSRVQVASPLQNFTFFIFHQVKVDLHLPRNNPVQVLLCVIVLLDAGIVIAQILLDLNNVKGNFRRISSNLTVNPFNASCSKLLLFEGFIAMLV